MKKIHSGKRRDSGKKIYSRENRYGRKKIILKKKLRWTKNR